MSDRERLILDCVCGGQLVQDLRYRFDVFVCNRCGAELRAPEGYVATALRESVTKCAWEGCDNPVRVKGRGRNPRYCSTACRMRAYRARQQEKRR